MSISSQIHMLILAIIVLILDWQGLCSATGSCQCEFPKHKDERQELEKIIAPLCGKRYDVKDSHTEGYDFTIGICTSAMQVPTNGMEKAGVVQVSKQNPTSGLYNTGSYDKAEIMSGTNWILLEYEGGGNYHTSCSNENKRTDIMIICNPDETVGKARWIEENHNKSGDCYYLFEIEHSMACKPVTVTKRLSLGSVVCIFIFSLLAVYLIGGFLFMRLCRRAKGLQQIPNYNFWRDFGALQADGCDLVCRCGSQQRESKAFYQGIGDQQIECAADSGDEYDEHLLPM